MIRIQTEHGTEYVNRANIARITEHTNGNAIIQMADGTIIQTENSFDEIEGAIGG